jgi:hypothetical protein
MAVSVAVIAVSPPLPPTSLAVTFAFSAAVFVPVAVVIATVSFAAAFS